MSSLDILPIQDPKRFKFNIPLEILKSDEKGWKVRGLASTEDKDLQGEIVKQNGLDISPLKEGRGLFNYEHKNDPENIVGCIENADISNKGLLVEGYLFKKHKRAQAIAEIMQSLSKDQSKRVQLSVEGKVKERGGTDNKEIKNATIDKVAITFEPVNQKTYLQFAKSLMANEELATGTTEVVILETSDPKEILVTDELVQEVESVEKTMTAAGGDAAPADRTGGAALQPESLDNKKHDLKEESEVKESKKISPKKPPIGKLRKKATLKLALKRAVAAFPAIPFSVLAKSVFSAFENRFLDNPTESGNVQLINGLPYIQEPNGILAPLGHNGVEETK